MYKKIINLLPLLVFKTVVKVHSLTISSELISKSFKKLQVKEQPWVSGLLWINKPIFWSWTYKETMLKKEPMSNNMKKWSLLLLLSKLTH